MFYPQWWCFFYHWLFCLFLMIFHSWPTWQNISPNDDDGFGCSNLISAHSVVWISCSHVWVLRVGRQIPSHASHSPRDKHDTLDTDHILIPCPCPSLYSHLSSVSTSSAACSTPARHYLVVVNYKEWLQITLMALWLQIRALWAPLYRSSL